MKAYPSHLAAAVAALAPLSARGFVAPSSIGGAPRVVASISTSSSPTATASSSSSASTFASLRSRRRTPTTRSIASSSSSVSRRAALSALSAASKDDECDVLVLGSGPAARAVATLLASPTADDGGFDILLADANYDRKWIPNYGVWQDEWESVQKLYSSYRQPLGASGCIDRKWEVTDCFFGGSFEIPVEERMRLDRPYFRVDRDALRRTLSPASEVEVENEGEGKARYRVTRSNHVSRAAGLNIYSPPGSMVHDDEGTDVLLRSKDGEETRVRARLVVDCTGHESKIVLKDDRAKSTPPGFQIAYGMLAKVDEASVPSKEFCGPYSKEAMTLFDYRTDHFPEGSDELSRAERSPTFMYAMPLEGDRIFFEETSLVARPAVSFQECKERCYTRLAHLGIEVLDVEEEEFCYIPMGGPLPARDQRVVGFGGAAAMVHPSTGYHICRAMMGAGDVAAVVREELGKGGEGFDPNRAAAGAYDAIWSPSNVAQRNFAVFGGEFLMKQNVVGLRGFFDGFFKLDLPLWGGFLAGWPGLPNNENHESWWARLVFGLSFVLKLPLAVAADMLGSIATYSIAEGVALPQSVTPLFGSPVGYGYKEKTAAVGDVAAKAEARKMIEESRVEDLVPVDFEEKVKA